MVQSPGPRTSFRASRSAATVGDAHSVPMRRTILLHVLRIGVELFAVLYIRTSIAVQKRPLMRPEFATVQGLDRAVRALESRWHAQLWHRARSAVTPGFLGGVARSNKSSTGCQWFHWASSQQALPAAATASRGRL